MEVTMERRVDVDGEVALDFPGDGNYNHRPPHSPTLGHTQWSQFSYENQTARPQNDPGVNAKVKRKRTPLEWLKKYFFEGKLVRVLESVRLC